MIFPSASVVAVAVSPTFNRRLKLSLLFFVAVSDSFTNFSSNSTPASGEPSSLYFVSCTFAGSRSLYTVFDRSTVEPFCASARFTTNGSLFKTYEAGVLTSVNLNCP